MSTKIKTVSKFSRFSIFWQTGNKYITLVGARFLVKSMRSVLFTVGRRHKFAKNRKKKLTIQNLPFFVFNIRILQDAMCCDDFGRFHLRKLKKITNKAMKKVKKKNCLGIYNSRLKPYILTEMIVRHYLIIVCYM